LVNLSSQTEEERRGLCFHLEPYERKRKRKESGDLLGGGRRKIIWEFMEEEKAGVKKNTTIRESAKYVPFTSGETWVCASSSEEERKKPEKSPRDNGKNLGDRTKKQNRTRLL